MKYRITRTKLPLAVAIVASILSGFLLFNYLSPLSTNASSEEALGEEQGTTEGYFVTIFDDGEQATMRSNAASVREFLERAEITYSKEDIIEPSLDTTIAEDNFNINIYRAREVVVIDGATRKYIRTAAIAPEAVVRSAGFKLRSADLVEIKTFNNVLESGMSVAYNIKRAKTIHVNLFGKATEVLTQAETVADLWREQGIKLDAKKNWSSLPANTKLTNNLSIAIYHQGKHTLVLEEPVPFKEKVTQDYSLDLGKSEIAKAGQNGKKTVTYEIEMHNGQELSRNILSELITQAPVDQEKRVGSKATAASSGSLPSGSHEDWMAAAGISPSDYGYVNFIISHESGWRPGAVSPNGYKGLYQTKNIASLCPNWQNDPVCQLRAASGYKNRYGSWEDAYNAWKRQGWW